MNQVFLSNFQGKCFFHFLVNFLKTHSNRLKIYSLKNAEKQKIFDKHFLILAIFDILKKVLTVGAVIGVVGMTILGVIIYREKQEERAMTIRRQNRERRRKEWGATTEFNLVMQEHLRSKNQFKKRSLWDKIKNWFRR